MKFRGTSVRFVMVSATVPNIRDVAAWIGNGVSGGDAIVMEVSLSVHDLACAHDTQFGEEYRPCKLKRYVVPVVKKRDQNDFQFARNLDFRLYGVLQDYAEDKPVLVFCATRKGTSSDRISTKYLTWLCRCFCRGLTVDERV